jgi:hypothetical protein
MDAINQFTDVLQKEKGAERAFIAEQRGPFFPHSLRSKPPRHRDR